MIVVILVVLLFLALIGVGTYFVLTMNSNDVPAKLAEVYKEYFPRAEKAQTSGIEKVVFDRGGYPFHGQVKAMADGAREGGLKF